MAEGERASRQPAGPVSAVVSIDANLAGHEDARGGGGTGVLEPETAALSPRAVRDIRTVFIAGYGRSGSTLLDVLLDNNGPRVFGAGELRQVFQQLRSGGRCSCGQLFHECPFWSRVVERLSGNGLNESAIHEVGTEASARSDGKLVRRTEASALAETDGSIPRWRGLFEAIVDESGAPIVVDSSKITLKTYRHLLRLERCGLELRVIHLVRDPRGVMWSVYRGSNELLEAGRPARLRGGMARGLLGWSLSNVLVELLCRRLRLPLMRVRYEDLVSDPVEQLRRIGAFTGIDPDPSIAKLVHGEPMTGGHGVRGNRLRRQGPIRISADEEWRERLPRIGRWLALLAWPLARRYGYDVASDLGAPTGARSRSGTPRD